LKRGLGRIGSVGGISIVRQHFLKIKGGVKMVRRYETASMAGREERAKAELGKEVQLRASILKQIDVALKKINASQKRHRM